MFGEFLNIVVKSLKLDKSIYKENKRQTKITKKMKSIKNNKQKS